MSVAIAVNETVEKQKRERKPLIKPGEDNFEAAERILSNKKSVVPFDSISEVNAVVTYLLQHNKFRDACLFVFGCNSTLRIGDILRCRWRNTITEDGSIKDTIAILENKNQNPKLIYTNDAVRGIIEIYLSYLNYEVDMNQFVFISEGNRKRFGLIKDKSVKYNDPDFGIKPLTEQLVSGMIRKVTKELGLYSDKRRFSTHSMRKTGARCAAGDLEGRDLPDEFQRDNANIERVRGFLGHKNVSTTRRYIGSDEKYNEKTYRWMNLGLEAIQKFNASQLAKEEMD